MKCDIEGVIIRKLTRHNDSRGWLAELYRNDEIEPGHQPLMSYVSMSKSNEVRGPHEHKEQTDNFAFIGPSTFRIYLWDNRPDSHTYRKKFTFTGGEDDPIGVIIPPGVVHAYKNIGNYDGYVINSPNRLYGGKNRKEAIDEIRYENINSDDFIID
jgi:dTDP-4-dehydrorhamnose 3,5-epimerase